MEERLHARQTLIGHDDDEITGGGGGNIKPNGKQIANDNVDVDEEDADCDDEDEDELVNRTWQSDGDDEVGDELVEMNSGRKRRAKKHYDETEALEAAKAWVRQSEEMANQRGNLFWEAVCLRLNERNGRNRGIDSVRAIWKRLNRECKLWLALELEVQRRGGTSGRDELQIEQLVSDLFSARTGKIGKDGIKIPGPPFKFKRVARFLSRHPKWDQKLITGRGRKKAVRNTGTTGSVAAPETAGGDEECQSRPIGTKRRKAREQDMDERRKMRKEMRSLNGHLGAANIIS